MDAGLYAYRNKFGECIDGRKNINTDYVLNVDGLNSVFDDFITMKYSKYYKNLVNRQAFNFNYDF